MKQVLRYKHKHDRRTVRSRGKIAGTDRPRLSVHRSNKFIFGQIISPDGKAQFGTRGKNPTEVGQAIAQKAVKAGMKSVVFDRGGYRYHGQVKLLAEAAREAGLQF